MDSREDIVNLFVQCGMGNRKIAIGINKTVKKTILFQEISRK